MSDWVDLHTYVEGLIDAQLSDVTDPLTRALIERDRERIVAFVEDTMLRQIEQQQVELSSQGRWHVGGFRVPPEATSVRLRLEVDGTTTLATATWAVEEPEQVPKSKRGHHSGRGRVPDADKPVSVRGSPTTAGSRRMALPPGRRHPPGGRS